MWKIRNVYVSLLIICSIFILLPGKSSKAEVYDDDDDMEGEVYYEVEVEDEGVEEPEEEIVFHRGRIVDILPSTQSQETMGDSLSRTQMFVVYIMKGPHKGEYIQAEYEEYYGFSDKYKAVPLSEGDEVFLVLQENEKGYVERAFVAEVVRDKYLLYLVIGFVLLLLIVGRRKGLMAIISLGLTAFAIIKILLPAILAGKNPVVISVLICVGVIGITLLLISGFHKKTIAAILGTAGGVILAGIIALIVGSYAKLTGLGDSESQMLMFIPHEVQFDFRGILFAGIIIGTLGATMDVGMSIASAMHEIKENSPHIELAALIKAGMNVGRDAMATMANTLILAYAGGSLHLMLLFMAYKTPFSTIINWDMIASEVLRAIAGSIGIIFAIPITALVSAFIEGHSERKNKHEKCEL